MGRSCAHWNGTLQGASHADPLAKPGCYLSRVAFWGCYGVLCFIYKVTIWWQIRTSKYRLKREKKRMLPYSHQIIMEIHRVTVNLPTRSIHLKNDPQRLKEEAAVKMKTNDIKSPEIETNLSNSRWAFLAILPCADGINNNLGMTVT